MANPSLPAQRTRLQHDSNAVDLATAVVIDGKVVVSSQQALVSNASTAHDLNATFSDTEVETALNNLGTKINSILTILKNHGLMADT